MVASVSESLFEQEVMKSDQPVLVDFWAPWCGPCGMMAPVLDQIATEFADRMKVVKVNVDENRSLAAQYFISSIPTLLLFKNGQPAGQITGFLPKNKLAARLEELL